jgi:hypothetical protein
MPDTINYDANKKRLLIGTGYVENVEPRSLELRSVGQAGVAAMVQLPEKEPGTPHHRRPPPALALGQHSARPLAGRIHTELINVLNVLGCLVDLEPAQAALLEKICSGPTTSADELRTAGALEIPSKPKRSGEVSEEANLL